MAKQKIIIGIHGLGNKPARRLLKAWWQKAICEGLERIGCHLKFKLEFVYWAHFLHSDPQKLREKDKKSPLYIEYPYRPAPVQQVQSDSGKIKKRVLDSIEGFMDKLFLSGFRLLNLDAIADRFIRKKVKDLYLYYRPDNVPETEMGLHARSIIRKELSSVLKTHRKKQIMLVAHSMGSIVAYDVLTTEVPEIKIHTFVTMGSPLGLPAVMKKIIVEQNLDLKNEKKVPVPENVAKAWFNFSDLKDNVAMNYNLSDDYKENSHGVGPVDFVVKNDYEINGKKNPHKSYGYLRAPEFSDIVYKFLTEEKHLKFESVKEWFRKWLG